MLGIHVLTDYLRFKQIGKCLKLLKGASKRGYPVFLTTLKIWHGSFQVRQPKKVYVKPRRCIISEKCHRAPKLRGPKRKRTPRRSLFTPILLKRGNLGPDLRESVRERRSNIREPVRESKNRKLPRKILSYPIPIPNPRSVQQFQNALVEFTFLKSSSNLRVVVDHVIPASTDSAWVVAALCPICSNSLSNSLLLVSHKVYAFLLVQLL